MILFLRLDLSHFPRLEKLGELWHINLLWFIFADFPNALCQLFDGSTEYNRSSLIGWDTNIDLFFFQGIPFDLHIVDKQTRAVIILAPRPKRNELFRDKSDLIYDNR